MKTLEEKYYDFVDELRSRRRHFLSDSSMEFLSSLKEIADNYAVTLEKGHALYRAKKITIRSICLPLIRGRLMR